MRRRTFIASLALPALQGCASPLPALDASGTAPEAQALLRDSAAAHGLAALSGMHDLNVSYAGHFHSLVGTLQPVLVDAGFRGRSEERLLLPGRLVAQAHSGSRGHKQVVRRTAPGGEGGVRVWLNGEDARDPERSAAAALVADGYSLFLLGPMLLAGQWAADRSLVMALAGVERLVRNGQTQWCDRLRIRMSPGIGFSASDDLELFIDREDRLMRRIRFTVNGLDSTRGAIADVATRDHVALGGVRWPTRFREDLLRPLPLTVHEWRLTGLDIGRGWSAADIEGAAFGGTAADPAGQVPSGTRAHDLSKS